MSNRIANDMRAGLIAKTLNLNMEQIYRESVEDLMSRTVGDVDQKPRTNALMDYLYRN